MTDESSVHPSDKLEDDKLQRFFDGDLTEGEAKVVGRDVARSELETARVAQLERLSDLVRLAAQDSPPFDSDALFERVSATVEEEKASSPRLRVIEGQRRKRTMGVVAIGLAAAAAVLLVFFQSSSNPRVAEHPMDDPREVLVENNLPFVEVHAPGGSEVEQIDFGANTGTVFEVEGEEGQPLAVVWIAEDSP